jgi:methyl-accepting chemotaxis protein
MNISKKIIIVSLSGIILLGIVALLLSVNSLQKRGAAETVFARSMMMAEKKGKLQDLIKSTYAVIQAHYDYAHDPEKVAATYRQQLKSIVDVAFKTVEQVHSRNDLNEAEKMRLAAELVGAMRYNETDYLWINDMGPTMIMHPIKPALNGKDLSDFKDPDGKKLFVAFVDVCRQNGEGTVDYLWPKPGHDAPVAKLSYVKLFKPWNWVIGTGVYLEAAEQRFMEDAKQAIAQLRYGPKGQDYFWINDMGPTMVMHPIKPELNGKDLSGSKDPNGKKLFVEFVNACRDKGEGFVDYMWPLPGHDDPVPKLSYVKLFEPWGWVVGTGIYLDDVDQAVKTKEAEIKAAISSQRNGLILIIVVLLALTAAGIAIISKRIIRPIVNTSAMLKDIAQGEGDLTRRLVVESNDEVGEMAKWFNVFIENDSANHSIGVGKCTPAE